MKEKLVVLDLIKSFFSLNSDTQIDCSAVDVQALKSLIKRTTLDGICYFGLLRTNCGSKELETWLKERCLIVKKTNEALAKMLLELKPFPLPVFLFKSPPFLTKRVDLAGGARYAADIDIYVDEKDLDKFDDFLAEKGFLMEGNGMDMTLPSDIRGLAFSINEDVSKSDAFRKEILTLIKNNTPLRQNNDRKRRVLNPGPNDKDISYYSPSGTLLETHHKFFIPGLPFKITAKDLDFEEIDDNLYALKPEDSIVVEACHFFKHIPRLTNYWLSQPCLLKYLTDLCFRMQEGRIDWQRVVRLSRETNASSQVYFYLSLGKNYLGISVPDEIMERLRGNGSQLQNLILNRIDGLKLLFSEPTLFSRLYAAMYFGDGNVKPLTAAAHAFYNKIFSRGVKTS